MQYRRDKRNSQLKIQLLSEAFAIFFFPLDTLHLLDELPIFLAETSFILIEIFISS